MKDFSKQLYAGGSTGCLGALKHHVPPMASPLGLEACCKKLTHSQWYISIDAAHL